MQKWRRVLVLIVYAEIAGALSLAYGSLSASSWQGRLRASASSKLRWSPSRGTTILSWKSISKECVGNRCSRRSCLLQREIARSGVTDLQLLRIRGGTLFRRPDDQSPNRLILVFAERHSAHVEIALMTLAFLHQRQTNAKRIRVLHRCLLWWHIASGQNRYIWVDQPKHDDTPSRCRCPHILQQRKFMDMGIGKDKEPALWRGDMAYRYLA